MAEINLVSIRNILNDYRHLDAVWIIYTREGEIYFHGVGEGGLYALTIDEAEKAAKEYSDMKPN